jgi:hypothetical protein
MVETTLGHLRDLLLHAGAMGCVLWEAEEEVRQSIALRSRENLDGDRPLSS